MKNSMMNQLGKPLFLSIVLSLWASVVVAAEPSISRLTPLAVKPGATTKVSVEGANLVNPTNLWKSLPGEALLSKEPADNGTKPKVVTYDFTVPPETPIGIHAVRIATKEGVSEPKMLMVDDLPSVWNSGKNQTRELAKAVTIPIGIDGVMPADVRHFYKFNVTEKQTVSFEVFARRIGSEFDPMLYVYDTNGKTLAYADDSAGLQRDCQLSVTFPTAGEYVLEVRDIAFRGSGKYHYRLRIGDYPLVHSAYPFVVSQASETAVKLIGREVSAQTEIKVPAVKSEAVDVNLKKKAGSSNSFVSVRTSPLPLVNEAEPNHSAENANVVSVDAGAGINGILGERKDVDQFKIHCKSGQWYHFQAFTRQYGSQADVVLKLFDPAGKLVKEADDVTGAEASFHYKAAAEGDYRLVVSELNRRGGPAHVYHVQIKPVQTGFTLTAETTKVNVPQAGTMSLLVKAQRYDYAGAIEVSATNLPAGVTSNRTVLGPGRNEVLLTLSSDNTEKAAIVQPITIVGKGIKGEQEVSATATVSAAWKTQLSKMYALSSRFDRALVFGNSPALPYRIKTEKAEVVLGPKLSTTVKVLVERDKDYNEAVALAVAPAKTGLPANLTVIVKPVEKDKNEAVVTFAAKDKIVAGTYTVVLESTLTKAKKPFKQAVPGITVQIQSPLKVSATVEQPDVKRTGTIALKVNVQRNPALAGEVSFKVKNLPEQIKLTETKLAADQSEVVLMLAVSDQAALGEIKNLIVQAELKRDKDVFNADSAPFAIKVIE